MQNVCTLSCSFHPSLSLTPPLLSLSSSLSLPLWNMHVFSLPPSLTLPLSAVNKRLNECSKNTHWSPEDNCFSFVYCAWVFSLSLFSPPPSFFSSFSLCTIIKIPLFSKKFYKKKLNCLFCIYVAVISSLSYFRKNEKGEKEKEVERESERGSECPWERQEDPLHSMFIQFMLSFHQSLLYCNPSPLLSLSLEKISSKSFCLKGLNLFWCAEIRTVLICCIADDLNWHYALCRIF